MYSGGWNTNAWAQVPGSNNMNSQSQNPLAPGNQQQNMNSVLGMQGMAPLNPLLGMMGGFQNPAMGNMMNLGINNPAVNNANTDKPSNFNNLGGTQGQYGNVHGQNFQTLGGVMSSLGNAAGNLNPTPFPNPMMFQPPQNYPNVSMFQNQAATSTTTAGFPRQPQPPLPPGPPPPEPSNNSSNNRGPIIPSSIFPSSFSAPAPPLPNTSAPPPLPPPPLPKGNNPPAPPPPPPKERRPPQLHHHFSPKDRQQQRQNREPPEIPANVLNLLKNAEIARQFEQASETLSQISPLMSLNVSKDLFGSKRGGSGGGEDEKAGSGIPGLDFTEDVAGDNFSDEKLSEEDKPKSTAEPEVISLDEGKPAASAGDRMLNRKNPPNWLEGKRSWKSMNDATQSGGTSDNNASKSGGKRLDIREVNVKHESDEVSGNEQDNTHHDRKTLKVFDKKFQQWEYQFESWKRANRNHPDKEAYNKYLNQWTRWRQQLIEQRVVILDKLSKTRQEASGNAVKKSFGNLPDGEGENANIPPSAASSRPTKTRFSDEITDDRVNPQVPSIVDPGNKKLGDTQNASSTNSGGTNKVPLMSVNFSNSVSEVSKVLPKDTQRVPRDKDNISLRNEFGATSKPPLLETPKVETKKGPKIETEKILRDPIPSLLSKNPFEISSTSNPWETSKKTEHVNPFEAALSAQNPFTAKPEVNPWITNTVVKPQTEPKLPTLSDFLQKDEYKVSESIIVSSAASRNSATLSKSVTLKNDPPAIASSSSDVVFQPTSQLLPLVVASKSNQSTSSVSSSEKLPKPAEENNLTQNTSSQLRKVVETSWFTRNRESFNDDSISNSDLVDDTNDDEDNDNVAVIDYGHGANLTNQDEYDLPRCERNVDEERENAEVVTFDYGHGAVPPADFESGYYNEDSYPDDYHHQRNSPPYEDFPGYPYAPPDPYYSYNERYGGGDMRRGRETYYPPPPEGPPIHDDMYGPSPGVVVPPPRSRPLFPIREAPPRSEEELISGSPEDVLDSPSPGTARRAPPRDDLNETRREREDRERRYESDRRGLRSRRGESEERERSRSRHDLDRDRGGRRDRSPRRRSRSKRSRSRSRSPGRRSRLSSSSNPPAPRYQSVLIEDILNVPGRLKRPSQIVIILRGLPGSGKSHLAKLIKEKESEKGGSAPRILALDDYFMQENEKVVKDPITGLEVKETVLEYEYDENLESRYRSDFIKTFKKNIDNGYFQFIIVDCVNNYVKHFEEMATFATQRRFQVYITEVEESVEVCVKRNVHHRTKEQIMKLHRNWERTPSSYVKLDARTLLQDEAIQEVEMEDVSDSEITEVPVVVPVGETEPISDSEQPETKEDSKWEDDDEEVMVLEDSGFPQTSKWETLEHSEEKLNKLDGLVRKRMAKDDDKVDGTLTSSIESWLRSHVSEDYVSRVDTKPGQKRVRWADIEERRAQERMRDVGFVVGHTDWKRMMDPTFGGSALTKTKYI